MTSYDVRFCDYCKGSVLVGQRWVREKIYDHQFGNNNPEYRQYHAEPFSGEDVSCWEKHWMEREIARTAVTEESAAAVQGMRSAALL